jgi:hypothetical protein
MLGEHIHKYSTFCGQHQSENCAYFEYFEYVLIYEHYGHRSEKAHHPP